MSEFKWFRDINTGQEGLYPADFSWLPTLVEIVDTEPEPLAEMPDVLTFTNGDDNQEIEDN